MKTNQNLREQLSLSLLLLAGFLPAGLLVSVASASNLDTIGVTLLRQTTTNLNGSGVRVAQPEAGDPSTAWEVDPAVAGLPATTFTYISSSGTAMTYPNSVGTSSPHASGVGQIFYGPAFGVATNVAHVDNYEANYFLSSVIMAQVAITPRIVNQSFVAPASDQTTLDTDYDTYAAQNNTLFASASGDGGTVSPPATCYNGIGVGAYGGATSTGPTPDNGRAKPDITAPADASSDSAPLVAGAAAVLLQAGLRGDGGSDTTSAVDIRTLKALLLNGAVKPADWSHPSPSPLDPRYGTGILNVFNSYRELAGGKHAFIASSSVPAGTAHAPTTVAGNVSSPTGWDFNTISSSLLDDGVNHYCFNLVASPASATFSGTLTLVWNRQANQTGINEMGLFLYNMATGALVLSSISTVDNVQHLFLTNLPPGRYDVEVVKYGGLGGKSVSNSETYALAFEFFTESVAVAHSANDVVVTWPVYPAGFVLESTPSLNPPVAWTTVNATPAVTNNQNRVTITSPSGAQFYRLHRP